MQMYHAVEVLMKRVGVLHIAKWQVIGWLVFGGVQGLE